MPGGRMHAGRCRERVTIYLLVQAKDPDTGALGPAVWTADNSDIPAEVEQVMGDEDRGDPGVETQRPYMVRLRGEVTLSEKNRIGWRSTWFNIIGMWTDPMGVWTEIKVIEELKEAKP
ncbi:MAG: head-tail adaptor protein [Planctomycetota bacterium]